MANPSTELDRCLELEIAMLRSRLADAEEMQRAIVASEVDGFVVGHGDDSRRILLLAPAPEGAQTDEQAHTDAAMRAIRNGEVDGFVVGGEQVMLLGDAHRPYQAMIDHMQQGAVTVSPLGEVLYVNDRFAAMTGTARERLLGSRVEGCFAPGDRGALRHLLDQSACGRGQAELCIGREDESVLPVLVNGARVGTDGPVILMCTDLTEERRHLEIAEANRRKDEFLSVLAHELRNPLAPIRNAVQVMSRLDGVDPTIRDLVTIIERQSATLARLLDDLLDIKRLGHGKLSLRMQPMEMESVVRNAVEAATPLIQDRGHALVVDLGAGPSWVNGDPVRLVQVVLNLLTNAAKYTPPGGEIRVVLTRDQEDAAGPCAVLSVSDNGLGIPASQLANVFEPYAQLGESRDSVTAGLGLGLTVARQLVELHGGSIAVRSEGSGHGSEFVVRLPIDVAALVGGPEAATSGKAPAVTGLRILVADDNTDGAHTLALLLRVSGHEVRTANDGLEALRVADEFRPHAAFVDLGMPGLDGFGVARELRQRPWADGQLALFALTGWNQPSARRRATEAGFDAHLVKPFDAAGLDRLLASIREP